MKGGVVKITSLFSKGLSCSDAIMPLSPILVFMCVRHLCKCPDDCCSTTLPEAWNIHFTLYRLKWQLLFYSFCIGCTYSITSKSMVCYQLSMENGSVVSISKLSCLDLTVGAGHFFLRVLQRGLHHVLLSKLLNCVCRY